MHKSVLYISYDGILEPLGQSQVLSYIEKLSKERAIYLISFEKKLDKRNRELLKEIKLRVDKCNIKWYPLTYHKTPTALATLFDILHSIVLSFWLVLRFNIKIIHARSYVPSLSALLLKKILGVNYIFDMRGFWPDERVDGGIWNYDSYLYKISKGFEKYFLLNADVVISLTENAVQEMRKFSYLKKEKIFFKVIPTCADLDLFNIKSKTNKQTNKQTIILGWVGSVGVWYLFDEALNYFKLILDIYPHSKLHVLNRGDVNYIFECIDRSGINPDSIVIESRDHKGVVDAMQLMDAGIFFIKPLFSKKASMPTKLGEFLGCGTPCVCNSGVGDMDEILDNENVGIVLNGFDAKERLDSISKLFELINDQNVKKRCRGVALKYFSLDKGVESYRKIYNNFDN
jgi:glycosyltransferase involved in cell wall biosynthesis